MTSENRDAMPMSIAEAIRTPDQGPISAANANAARATRVHPPLFACVCMILLLLRLINRCLRNGSDDVQTELLLRRDRRRRRHLQLQPQAPRASVGRVRQR